MKKIRILTVLVLLFAICISGCGAAPSQKDKLSIVCTNFPAYDWVNQIIGGNAEKYEVTLLGGGGDIHSYQPVAKDIALIQTCDLFIYVGGVSDIWAEKTVKENNINSLKLTEVLKNDLLCADEGHNHNHHEGEEFDEHIWLSLKLADKSVDAICQKLAALDKDNAAVFEANRAGYTQQLTELDGKYRKAVEESEDKTIVFADRFPFLYMVRDYGIKYFAAFPGCSADSDAGFEVVAILAKAVDENQKETVLVLENSGLSVADTVINSTKSKSAKTVVMNSCQSVGWQDIQNGASYLKIMETNLESLKTALQ